MSAEIGVNFTGLSATTSIFTLPKGGYYVADFAGATFSSSNHFDLQRLGPDNATYIAAGLAGPQTGTAGTAAGYLPAGTYKFTLSGTLSGVAIALRRCALN